MNTTEARPWFSSPARTLPRAIRHIRPWFPGLGFGFASVHEGPPPAVHDDEMRLAEEMPPARRADFLVGRCALHRALRDAGLTAGAVLRAGRRPLLPAGIAASISHSGGVAVALAGPAGRFAPLGVDVELTGIPPGAAHLVLRPAEASLIEGPREISAARLLGAFSAKEAAFKALSPRLGDRLPGLRSVRLHPHPGGYVAFAEALPGIELDVTVRHLTEGVLSWALPRRL